MARHWISFLFVSSAFLAGCEDSETAAHHDGGHDADTQMDATMDSGGNNPNTVQIHGTIVDFANDAPLAATVCAGSNCATASASNGAYTLDLPKNSDVTLTIELTAYKKQVSYLHTDDEDFVYSTQMISNVVFSLNANLIGVDVDATKGSLNMYAYKLTNGEFPDDNDDVSAGTEGLPGASYTASPVSGKLAWLNADGLSYSTSGPTSSQGIQVAANADPGSYAVTVSPPEGYDCNTRWMREGSTAGTLDLEVVADAMTFFWLRCVEN
ncbi:MAG: hypothetical protein R3A78_04595 [Polyangiales bacterium]|nr:hypothetical protein [Myxococcales bacterium]